MTFYKKIIIGIAALELLSCSAYMIYNVNSVFPNADSKAYRTGDVTRYRGLKLTVGEVGIYTQEELEEKYPDVKNIDSSFQYDGNGNYVIANITLENDTDETVELGKLGSVTGWVIETDMYGNGMSYFTFLELNPSYGGQSFSKGQKQELILPFHLGEEWITYDKLTQEDIKIIYSFYPTKAYILHEGKSK